MYAVKFLLIFFAISMLTTGCGSHGGDFTVSGDVADATIYWIAPTTNADGSPLNDLAGYRVYYGPSSGVYTKSVAVPGADKTTYSFYGLAGGDYYMAVTAYDTSGNESVLSVEVVKTVT